MPQIYLNQPLQFPTPMPFDTNGLVISNRSIASGNRIAYVFQAPASGTIDQVIYMLSTTAIGASSKVRVSLQSVVSGNPKGIQDQYYDTSPTVSFTFISGSLTNTGAAGGSQRNVNRGDLVAAVVEFSIFNTGDTISVPAFNINGFSRLCGEEHWTEYAVATNTWSQQFFAPTFGLKYADGNYYGFMQGGLAAYAASVGSTSFNSSSNPNEIGLMFALPFACQIGGAAFFGTLASATADYNWNLYDANNNLLTSYGASGVHQISISTKVYRASLFPSVINLLPNTTYRIAMKPATTNNITFYYDNVLRYDTLPMCAPVLPTWIQTQRQNAGAWSQVVQLPQIYLLLQGFSRGDLIPIGYNGLAGGFQ